MNDYKLGCLETLLWIRERLSKSTDEKKLIELKFQINQYLNEICSSIAEDYQDNLNESLNTKNDTTVEQDFDLEKIDSIRELLPSPNLTDEEIMQLALEHYLNELNKKN